MKYFIKTFGCQMNVYDSEKIAVLLHMHFHADAVADEKDADILIINTCSIRENAHNKLFDQLGRWKKLKVVRPRIIAAGGCVVTQEGENVFRRAHHVDIVFGPQNIHSLPSMIRHVMDTGQSCMDIAFSPEEKFRNLPQSDNSHNTKAFISVMEGCSKFCAYCIVPYTRGPEISRDFDDILVEVRHLLDGKIREIHFLGQNVNAYRGTTHDGNLADLATLIRYTDMMDGCGRIRFTTSHPAEFDDRLCELYRDVSSLVSHIHLPAQHGSNKILQAMRRNYTRDQYCDIVKKLRLYRPDINIASDFIVGFPGETDADFDELIDFVRTIQFDHSFSFIYSPRPGTPAADFSCALSRDTKKKRLSILQQELEKSAFQYSQAMLGRKYPVLLESVSTYGNTIMGRTENNRVVHIDAPHNHIGSIVDVEINAILKFSLKGQMILS